MTRVELNLNWLLYIEPALHIDEYIINLVWPTSTRLSGYIMRSHPNLVPKTNTMPTTESTSQKAMPAPAAPIATEAVYFEPPVIEPPAQDEVIEPMSEDDCLYGPAFPMSEDEI